MTPRRRRRESPELLRGEGLSAGFDAGKGVLLPSPECSIYVIQGRYFQRNPRGIQTIGLTENAQRLKWRKLQEALGIVDDRNESTGNKRYSTWS